MAMVVAVVIGLGILLLALGFAVLRERRRVRRLRQRFGPEYVRTIRGYPDREAAELELQERLRRHEGLDLRQLPDDARRRYLYRFVSLQGAFETDPRAAVAGADTLVIEILRARGYPFDSADQLIADMSVDHPAAAEEYRTAQTLTAAPGRRRRQLRSAFARYERIVYDVLDVSRQSAGARPGADPAAR